MVDTSWLGQGFCELHPAARGIKPGRRCLGLCLRSLFRTSPGRGDALLSCRAQGRRPTLGGRGTSSPE